MARHPSQRTKLLTLSVPKGKDLLFTQVGTPSPDEATFVRRKLKTRPRIMDSISISQQQKRGSTVIWLAYTAFLFLEPIFEPNLLLWVKTLAVFALFLGIFFLYVDTCNPKLRMAMAAATVALGIITYPWNPGGSTFFIYAAGFFPFAQRSARWSIAFFAFESAVLYVEGRWSYHSMTNTYMGIFLLLVIGGSNIFFAEQKRSDSKLRMAHEEIEALAAVAERERIARDLHDVLGHTLSLIVLKAELAGRLMERDPARAAAEIADVETTARTALSEVREAIGGYRARGLAAEIEAARRTLDVAGVTLILDSDTPGVPGSDSRIRVASGNLTAGEETVLSLALREAITNIVRHAQAKTCRLRFISEQGHRRLIVEDDGEHPLTREGNGLRGMRERVEAIGGHVSLNRDSGTRLLIELPLRAEATS
jgi:two-component system sensor histidine kinase DesK